MFVVGGEREGFEGFACYEDRLNWFGVLLYACTVCAICAFLPATFGPWRSTSSMTSE